MGLNLALGRVMIKKEIKNSLVIINRARRMESGPGITQMGKKNMKLLFSHLCLYTYVHSIFQSLIQNSF